MSHIMILLTGRMFSLARALSLFRHSILSLSLARSLSFSRSRARALSLARARALSPSLPPSLPLSLSLSLSRSLSRALSLALSRALSLSLSLARSLSRALSRALSRHGHCFLIVSLSYARARALARSLAMTCDARPVLFLSRNPKGRGIKCGLRLCLRGTAPGATSALHLRGHLRRRAQVRAAWGALR